MQIAFSKYIFLNLIITYIFNQELDLLYGSANDKDAAQSYTNAMDNNGQMISYIKHVRLQFI